MWILPHELKASQMNLFLQAPLSKLWTPSSELHMFPDVPQAKVGTILKKNVDWIDTNVILPEESIDKAIVSLQIPEVLNDEAIQLLFCKKFESAKRLYCFEPQNF
jgi:hypothetical protein